MIKEITLIISDDRTTGSGTEGDPYRTLIRLYTKEGDLVLQTGTLSSHIQTDQKIGLLPLTNLLGSKIRIARE